jgi:hypothetical protein
VFMLLQAIFQAFDRLAKKRSVFKVETIGDCYVAVTGLPDPQVVSQPILPCFTSGMSHVISEGVSVVSSFVGSRYQNDKVCTDVHAKSCRDHARTRSLVGSRNGQP